MISTTALWQSTREQLRADTGATALQIWDLGGSVGGVAAFNNYINAQGWLVDSASTCTGSAPDARAVELLLGPGAAAASADRLDLFNNLVDSGGRACRRYGVWEVQPSVPADLFVTIDFAYNAFVQADTERDATPAGYHAIAYLESDNQAFCDAAASDVVGTDCFVGAVFPTTSTYYLGNLEVDPDFAGSELLISEIPGLLPASDFRVGTAASTGPLHYADRQTVLPLPYAPLNTDFEDEARASAIVCDIGHDENTN